MSEPETAGSGGGDLTSKSPNELVILHGDLELEVIEARCLPNMDLFSESLRGCFAACGLSSSTRSPHRRHRHVITSDPYVSLVVADAVVARTRVIPNTEDPVWNDRFLVPLAHFASHVRFLVKDNDVVGAQLIGTVSIPASRLASGEPIKEWFPVIGSNGKVPKADAALHVSMKFTPVEKNPFYACGIAGDPALGGVREAYFPVRKGCGLTLYQDAHVRDGELPEVKMGDGRIFAHEKCWEDICQAIVEAHHLIYLVGWSIYDKVRLVREPTRPFPKDVMDMTLGDLLKYKSQEGVRILLLVWDDKTSHDKFGIKTAGVMQTHDEETKKFFKHSSVTCVLSPRYASSKLSFFKQQVVGTLYTHHQKCVLVDSQGRGNTRKITAFIGGLDLCDGRYDTPEHRIFQDLDTIYKNDFHNPIFSTEAKGPRQPWHDLHCKIEGPAAYDVLTNFEQRWHKATKWWEYVRLKRVTHSRDDAMIKLERISWILSPSDTVSDDDPSLWVSSENDSDTWHVQIFRSIDSGSVKGFPESAEEALQKNLVLGKDLLIDKSIQMAYVKAIRSAKHFVYIENQYFLGSSYGWPSYNSPGADNLIPLELAFKIASKIRARERFAVYIVIPMWPEGIPTDASIQEILFWQYQTIQMMYGVVAKELKSCNLEESDPQDYLNFYCLGNRERPLNDIPNSNQTPGGATEALSQKYRRFMIYVHAKGMIVDDEYVIIGSANINQRSLDGTRDTEIAMGAYQPHNSWVKKGINPQCQIHGYRKSLWAEHLGMVDGLFNEPHSLECVRMVNKVARDNWKNYTAEEYVPLTGHLIKYPYQVEADGKVGPIPNQETFPDVGGKITGAPTNLPDDLTM